MHSECVSTDTLPEVGLFMKKTSHEDLLVRIAADRDRSAFQELFAQFGPRAFALARHLTGNIGKAEEVAQDALLAIWQKADRFDRTRGSAEKWMLRIVANKALVAARKSRSEKNHERALLKERMEREEPGADGALRKEELLGTLRTKLDELPGSLRQILALYFAGDMSQEEIAKTLTIPQSTISLRIRQGLEELRGRLKEAGFASALPLVTMERFGKALQQDLQLPAPFEARLFSQLDAAAPTPESTAKVEKKAPWIFKGAVLVVLAIGIGYWAITHEPPTTSPGVKETNQDLVVDESEKAVDQGLKLRNLSWTFGDGVPKDLLLIRDGWQIGRYPGSTTSVLKFPAADSKSHGLIALPVRLRRTPFVLTVVDVEYDFGATHLSLVISDGHSLFEGRVWRNPRQLRAYKDLTQLRRTESTWRIWYFGRYFVLEADGNLMGVRQFSDGKLPGNRFILGVSGIAIKSIQFCEILKEELPARLHNTEALIASLEKRGIKPEDTKIPPMPQWFQEGLAKQPQPEE